MGQEGIVVSVPSGHTPAAFERYYHYLFRRFYMRSDGGVTWQWLSLQNNLRYILLWVGWLVVIALGLFLLTRSQGRSRFRHDLYPQEHYDGFIQERVGPPGILIIVWCGMLAWSIFLTVEQILLGQVY